MGTQINKTMALIVAVALLLALCACGGKTEEMNPPAAAPQSQTAVTGTAKAEETKSDAAGYYKIVKSTENGEEQDLSSMVEMGITFYLVLNEDGSGYMDMFGKHTPLRWNESELFFEQDGAGVRYSYAGGQLTLENDGATMLCERLSDAEKTHYIHNGAGSIEDLFGDITWDDLPEVSDIPEGAPSAGPVSALLGECEVSILGAEAVENDDGTPAIRFWYEFTNYSEKLDSAFSALFADAAQDGNWLDAAYRFDDIPEAEYDTIMVGTGHTIRCAALYTCDPDGGTVAFRLSALDGSSLIYYTDPRNTFGAPEDDFLFRPDNYLPDFMVHAPDTDGSVYILDDMEVVEDQDGDDMLRIYVSFTNHTEETTCFFGEYNVYAMQDGYSLESTSPLDEIEEDGNDIVDVEPGNSITCALSFKLRSDGPIAIVMRDVWGESGYFGDILVAD